MKKLILFFSFIFLFSGSLSAKEIKIALLAPEGSTWMKLMHEWDKEVREKTQNKVGFKFYPGGVMGDEKDVLRKMRIGQLDAGAFTGLGGGTVLSEVRVLELPFLFDTHEQATKVRRALAPQFEKDFLKKGYVVLGWAENGFVYIFSKKPVRSEADLKIQKMWAWTGDPLVEQMYSTFQITPVSLAMPEVLPSLQTNLVEGVYCPPLACLATQWFTAVSYLTDFPLAYASGMVLLTQKTWGELSVEEKKVLKETGAKYTEELNQRITQDNKEAFALLIQNGIKKVELPDSEKEAIRKKSLEVHKNLSEKLYSPALLQKVRDLL